MLQSLEMVTHATLTQFEAVSLTLQAEGLSLGTAGSQGSRTPTQETSLATFANLLQMLKGHAQAMQEKLNLIKPFENAADARKIGCGAPDDAAVTRASLAPSAAPPKHQTSALLPSSKHCVHTIALRNPRKLEVRNICLKMPLTRCRCMWPTSPMV